MYYYFRGTLAALTNKYAAVDCGGVAYKLGISLYTFGKLSGFSGREVTLYSHLTVRDDALELYGFSDENELALFKLLTSVSGVGPKGAMAILGALTPDKLAYAVSRSDAPLIATSPGIGQKTAQKIVIELKDKITPSGSESDITIPDDGSKLSQAADALSLYGFSKKEVALALQKVNPKASLEEIIREALQMLAKD